jgi:hypothetical protein
LRQAPAAHPAAFVSVVVVHRSQWYKAFLN